MELASLALQVALTLVGAAILEVPVALYVTRPKVRADTAQLVENARKQLRDELVAELKPAAPGVMRGGMDPVALNEARAAKQEEKALTALATEVEVKTFLA